MIKPAEEASTISEAAEPPRESPEPAPEAAGDVSAQPAQDEPAAETAVPAAATAVRYTPSGYRYVLGYGQDFFGIWDRQSPTQPTERFERTDEGWRAAWLRFVTLEPNHVAVTDGEHTPTPSPSPSPSQAAASAGSDDALQYTHSGQRYLLGYGTTFFGIWDRQAPQRPVERFPRTDEGWAEAWRRFTQIETHYSEVSLGNSGS
jgi:hypothetical protein